MHLECKTLCKNFEGQEIAYNNVNTAHDYKPGYASNL